MAKVLDRKTQKAMSKIANGLPSKAEKIRRLRRADYDRSTVAEFLGISYQHVRNVEMRAKEKEAREAGDTATDSALAQVWVQVGPDGRVVIPAAYRPVLGVEDGGPVMLRLEGDEVRIIGRDTAITRVQDMVAKYVPEGVSLVDELLADRRREVEREEREARKADKAGRSLKRA